MMFKNGDMAIVVSAAFHQEPEVIIPVNKNYASEEVYFFFFLPYNDSADLFLKKEMSNKHITYHLINAVQP